MADEPIELPDLTKEPQRRYVPVDQGLADWANLVHDHLVTVGGVEMTGRAGGSVVFKFRGQTFVVTIRRTS